MSKKTAAAGGEHALLQPPSGSMKSKSRQDLPISSNLLAHAGCGQGHVSDWQSHCISSLTFFGWSPPTDIRSDMYSGILSNIYSDMLLDRYILTVYLLYISDILSDTYSDKYSDMFTTSLSDVLYLALKLLYILHST